MKTIFRVENPADGYGIFACTGPNEESRWSVLWGDMPTVDNRHQSFNNPREDGLEITKDKFCAYKTLERLQEMVWHEELLTLVNERGFRVYRLQVSQFEEGKDNVLFKKADVVEKTDITYEII